MAGSGVHCQAGITRLALHPTQPWLTSTSEDATLKLWDFEGNLEQTIDGHDAALLGVAWHPSGQELVASTVTGQLYRWAADGSAIARWSAAPAPIWDVAYSPNGAQFATASNDGNLRLWNRQGDLLHTLEHGSAVWRIAYSSDSRWIATGSGDNTARLWRPEGTLVARLRAIRRRFGGLAFSPDGSLMATASIDETVKLWSLDCLSSQLCPHGVLPQPTPALINTLKQHNSGVRSVAFNREGTVLASVGDDETVVLWNLEPILNLDPLAYGCAWVTDYLRTNSGVAERDRRLCQGLKSKP